MLRGRNCIFLVDYVDELDDSIVSIIKIHSVVLAVFIILMWLYVVFMIGKYVIRPIRKLSGAANSWVAQSDKMNTSDHFKNLGIKHNDEIRDLNNQLGQEGLFEALNAAEGRGESDIINYIWEVVSDFQKGKEQSDDVTIVLLEA